VRALGGVLRCGDIGRARPARFDIAPPRPSYPKAAFSGPASGPQDTDRDNGPPREFHPQNTIKCPRSLRQHSSLLDPLAPENLRNEPACVALRIYRRKVSLGSTDAGTPGSSARWGRDRIQFEYRLVQQREDLVDGPLVSCVNWIAFFCRKEPRHQHQDPPKHQHPDPHCANCWRRRNRKDENKRISAIVQLVDAVKNFAHRPNSRIAKTAGLALGAPRPTRMPSNGASRRLGHAIVRSAALPRPSSRAQRQS